MLTFHQSEVWKFLWGGKLWKAMEQVTDREKAPGRTQVNHWSAVVHTSGCKQVYCTCSKKTTWGLSYSSACSLPLQLESQFIEMTTVAPSKRCIVLQTAFNGHESQHVDMTFLIMVITNPSIVCPICSSYAPQHTITWYTKKRLPAPPLLKIRKPSTPKRPRLPACQTTLTFIFHPPILHPTSPSLRYLTTTVVSAIGSRGS